MRYFVQRAPAPRSDDSYWWPTGNSWHIPNVPDHQASDTGLVDVDGNAIMRAANPMGFVWDEIAKVEGRKV